MRPRPRSLVAVGLVLTAIGCGSSGESSATSPGTPPSTAATTGPGQPGPTGSGPSPGQSPDDSPAASTDAGRTLTAADDGVVIDLDVGEQVELVQSDPLAPDPSVTGDAVELVEVVNVTGSNQREWEVRARAPGTADLSVPDASDTFHVTIEVR
jgi:hypothetical protein